MCFNKSIGKVCVRSPTNGATDNIAELIDLGPGWRRQRKLRDCPQSCGARIASPTALTPCLEKLWLLYSRLRSRSPKKLCPCLHLVSTLIRLSMGTWNRHTTNSKGTKNMSTETEGPFSSRFPSSTRPSSATSPSYIIFTPRMLSISTSISRKERRSCIQLRSRRSESRISASRRSLLPTCVLRLNGASSHQNPDGPDFDHHDRTE
ncbi:hypothetical protein BGZ61DRAFT_133673 [Ilyonectria robusta]|uniref:uncharacterized protein n=1 Tax=Ilyonectria robusta TaxID=1079257 RepID=UPI001E8DB500|nr:uncharacterized protein BGZ61DRAFT_133673 [Ilyonectria robusta]KAH8735012.1 hypothetical protein BGZ61DRAFT_133673 [Ilyonectria robusta]